MTGIVLALAGLTAGDGGPGLGAATAPVAPNLAVPWKGTVRFNGSAPFQMEFVKGGMLVHCRGTTTLLSYDLVSSPRGRVRLLWGEGCLGAFRLEGGRLHLSLRGKAAEQWGEYLRRWDDFLRYRDRPPPVPLP